MADTYIVKSFRYLADANHSQHEVESRIDQLSAETVNDSTFSKNSLFCLTTLFGVYFKKLIMFSNTISQFFFLFFLFIYFECLNIEYWL